MILALPLHFLSNLHFAFKWSSLLPGDLSSVQELELVYSSELSNFRFLSLPVVLQNTGATEWLNWQSNWINKQWLVMGDMHPPTSLLARVGAAFELPLHTPACSSIKHHTTWFSDCGWTGNRVGHWDIAQSDSTEKIRLELSSR